LDAGERLPSGTASEVAARLQGTHVDGAVVVLGAARLARENERLHLASEPGALGDALEKAGHAAAVVANADVPDPLEPGTETIARPAALAVMDRDGGVDEGKVGAELLLDDPTAPFGVRADPARVTDETLDALSRASVVVVDPGDTTRAAAMRPYASDAGAARAMREAVGRTDAILASLEQRLPPRTLLLVLSVTPRTSTWALAPAVVSGDGVTQGRIVSPSTKRAGVVTITDVAPTILAALGAEVPSEMAGQSWRYQEGGGELSSFRRLHEETEFRDSIYRPATTAYVVVEVILHIFAIFALSRRGGPGRYGPALRFLLLSAAAFPLATFVFRALPGSYEMGGASLFALAALSALIAAAVRNLRRHPLQPLTTIMGVTIVVLVADVATGSRLHVSSILGYSLQSAGRFYGFPNTTFAVLAACTLLVVATHVHYARDRGAALLRAGLLLAVVVVADVAPGVGDDVGGVLALVPVGALAFLAMAFGRVSLRRIAIASAATIAVLATVTLADLLRPEDQQAHLGRFFSSLVDGGDDVFFETVRRKEAANFRILSNSVWTWIIPAAASLMLYLLVWERRFVSIVPSGSALRVGVIATVVASLLGFAVNDSGPVITALFFVFLGPFLVLLALDHDLDRADELYEPRRAVAPVRMVGSS
ncbi:MAG TPA: hypothetical protein VFV35_07330, partial [Acidimicrobiales bacterium]|nr:hypothetical protein [Acidimicrobiales bacterium]